MSFNLDDFLISRAQRAYDYIWDRFGVPVGFVALMFDVMAAAAIGSTLNVFAHASMAVAAIVAAMLMVEQLRGNLTYVNATTQYLRRSLTLRPALLICVTFQLGAWAAYAHTAWPLVVVLSVICSTQIKCVFVNKRNPDRFRRSAPHTAPQGA